MNLIFVTYNSDLTQYLIDARNYDEAIQKAIEANKSEVLGPYDEELYDDISDPGAYSIDLPVDMDLLGEICRRTDYVGNYKGVLIFSGG